MARGVSDARARRGEREGEGERGARARADPIVRRSRASLRRFKKIGNDDRAWVRRRADAPAAAGARGIPVACLPDAAPSLATRARRSRECAAVVTSERRGKGSSQRKVLPRRARVTTTTTHTRVMMSCFQPLASRGFLKPRLFTFDHFAVRGGARVALPPRVRPHAALAPLLRRVLALFVATLALGRASRASDPSPLSSSPPDACSGTFDASVDARRVVRDHLRHPPRHRARPPRVHRGQPLGRDPASRGRGRPRPRQPPRAVAQRRLPGAPSVGGSVVLDRTALRVPRRVPGAARGRRRRPRDEQREPPRAPRARDGARVPIAPVRRRRGAGRRQRPPPVPRTGSRTCAARGRRPRRKQPQTRRRSRSALAVRRRRAASAEVETAVAAGRVRPAVRSTRARRDRRASRRRLLRERVRRASSRRRLGGQPGARLRPRRVPLAEPRPGARSRCRATLAGHDRSKFSDASEIVRSPFEGLEGGSASFDACDALAHARAGFGALRVVEGDVAFANLPRLNTLPGGSFNALARVGGRFVVSNVALAAPFFTKSEPAAGSADAQPRDALREKVVARNLRERDPVRRARASRGTSDDGRITRRGKVSHACHAREPSGSASRYSPGGRLRSSAAATGSRSAPSTSTSPLARWPSSRPRAPNCARASCRGRGAPRG